MPNNNAIPVYKQLVEKLRLGFGVLDEPVQAGIKTFIKNQQHMHGAFVDRAGNPDIYYSLFGLWLTMATGQRELQKRLREYIKHVDQTKLSSPVEELSLLIQKVELDTDFKKKSAFSIIRSVMKRGRSIELSYQFFLVAVAMDAGGKNKNVFYFLAKLFLFFYKAKNNFPCSLVAALVFAKNMLGVNSEKDKELLLSYISNNTGFRAFKTTPNADLLSTGVSLFSLKESNTDLRMIAPGCMDFIQENYVDGAFLSGDGDATKDLEYTFYGLLALGSLV